MILSKEVKELKSFYEHFLRKSILKFFPLSEKGQILPKKAKKLQKLKKVKCAHFFHFALFWANGAYSRVHKMALIVRKVVGKIGMTSFYDCWALADHDSWPWWRVALWKPTCSLYQHCMTDNFEVPGVLGYTMSSIHQFIDSMIESHWI